MVIGEIESDARLNLPFLRAGVHEKQIFLPIVEETEIALRIVSGESRCDRWRRRFHDGQRARRSRLEQDAASRRRAIRVVCHEGANTLERIRSDAAAVAQAAGKLAVVDGAPAEC